MRTQMDVNPARERSRQEYQPSPVRRAEHAEGSLTRAIEQHTAKVPSDFFLFAAMGAMGLSLYFHLTDRPNESRFVGMWAPTILTMGVYNKVVKVFGPQ